MGTTYKNFQDKLVKTAEFVEKNKIPYKNKFRGSLAAIKKYGVNCTAYVSIAMKWSGMTKKAYNFYCQKGKIKGKDAAIIKKNFKCKQNVNKSISECVKKGIVKTGDIVGAQKNAHTMVYRGKANGKYVFYSLGGSRLTKKKICNNARKGSYKVGVVIRPTYKKPAAKPVTAKKVSKSTTVNKVVALYVGHGTSTNGSWDAGCVYKSYTEAGLMKPIVESAVKYLEGSGVTVITDAPKNNINMVKQVQQSNAKKVLAHVAVHCDYSKAPAGTIPLYTSANGKKLAASMNKYVIELSSLKTRGLGYRTDLYELNQTNAPACIFEAGCISKDLKKFQKEYDKIGKGIAHGICDFIGVNFTGKKK